MSARAVRFLVAGRVQGVSFRYYAAKTARGLGLVGRVRNLADGRVEAEAAGSEEALAAFADWLRQGPPAARVASVTEEKLAGTPGWESFEIDRSSLQ